MSTNEQADGDQKTASYPSIPCNMPPPTTTTTTTTTNQVYKPRDLGPPPPGFRSCTFISVEKKWVLCDKATADQVRREHVDTLGILLTVLCPLDWTDERLVAEQDAYLANPNRARKLSKKERVRREVLANMDPEVLANTMRNKKIIVADKEDQTLKKKTHQKKVRCKLTGPLRSVS